MGKILVVAEKPSVGRDIAKNLKCTGKKDGCLFSDEYIVTWAIGHLVTLCEPEDYSPLYKSWKINTLPIIPEEIKLKPIATTKKQLDILKALFADKEVESLICATDSGREGELIFRYIYNLLKCKKPFKRLWISSMTDSAISEGFKNLKPGSEYDNLYLSAKCRSQADWLVGINATRAYTIKYNALLSVGRVQTPTLAILVNRQTEINDFVPMDYWEVRGDFDGYFGTWFDHETKDSKITDKEKAQSIVGKVTGKTGLITEIETEEKKQPAPLLYDLTELQRDCNKRFGYSAQKTLSIAQDLYEKRKVITYPRTDSRHLSDDMIPKIHIILKRLLASEYSDFAQYITDLSKLPITKRIVDNNGVTDHHAIIPTEAPVKTTSLSPDEFNVYDLIIRRFLSVFYPVYITATTRITTVAEDEPFMTKGTTVLKLGWMELYKNDSKNNSNGKEAKDEDILPNVSKGDTPVLKEALLQQKKTTPPKAYTEGTLLSAMENPGRFVDDDDIKNSLKESGLGTAATRASIIERLIQVGYLQRKGKALQPTEKGMKLIEIVPSELKSPETTGKWEKGLTSISKGKMDDKRFMSSITAYVNYIIETSVKSSSTVVFPQENRGGEKKKTLPKLGDCPKCGNGDILENKKAFYCSSWQNGCKFTMWKNSIETYGTTITSSLVKTLLKDKLIKSMPMSLPQTGEACTADLTLRQDMSGSVDFINLKRVQETETTKPEDPPKTSS